VTETLDMGDRETTNRQERDNLMMASTVIQKILVSYEDTKQALRLVVVGLSSIQSFFPSSTRISHSSKSHQQGSVTGLHRLTLISTSTVFFFMYDGNSHSPLQQSFDSGGYYLDCLGLCNASTLFY
jgi:hypothetical protein